MAREPDIALLMTASGFLSHKKIIADISSKSTASPAMRLTFAIKPALSKIIHVFDRS